MSDAHRGRDGHGDASREAPKIFSPEYYARLHAVEESHWYVWGMRRIALALLRAHGYRGGGLVLDAGCGTGGTLRWLVSRFPACRGVGVDVAAPALAHVRPTGSVRVLQASATDLPFGASIFRLVVSFDVLQHLPEGTADVAALAEAARVLCPGGFLLVRAAAGRRGDRLGGGDDAYHRFRRDELGEKIRAAGFRVLRVTFVNWLLSMLDDTRKALRPARGAHGADPGLSIQAPRRPWLSVGQRLIMRAEARYLGRGGRDLPYGHTLMALAVREPVTRGTSA